ncbi:MAG: hypothetical protein WC479_07120 [Candidatus Izemoplasmatales bacterium]|jgi:hypothetical protein
MSYGIFKLNKELTAIFSPDAVKLCPELAYLNDDQVKYVILVYDFIDSPYRLKPLEERKRIAKDKIFSGKSDPEVIPHVQKAIKAYQSLLYDSKHEQIEICKTKINQLQKKLRDEDEPKLMEQITKTISFLRNEQDKMEKEIAIDEEMVEIQGGNKLSWIEIWKRNKMNFNRE